MNEFLLHLVAAAQGHTEQVFLVLSLFGAIAVLDAVSVSMPRGDRVSVSGAICASSVVMIGLPWALVVSIGALLCSHLVRWHAIDVHRLAGEMSLRAGALAVASAVFVLLESVGGRGAPGVAVIILPALYLALELIGNQAYVAWQGKRDFLRLLRGNIRAQWPLLAAEWSAAALLLITYDEMGAWSLVPVSALLFLMRQSYALLHDIRETYRTTMEVLVEAAEGQDSRRIGHSERTAAIARTIAMRMGLNATEVERVSYAALLHDIDVIAGTVPSEAKQGASGRSALILKDASFFSTVVPILELCDGDGVSSAKERDLTAALIVCLASDADAADNQQVAVAHSRDSIDRVVGLMSPGIKSRVVAAALSLGLRTPAVR